jgi:hypothetical protein
MLRLVTSLSLALIGTQASAEIQHAPFLVAGLGLAACQEWTAARQAQTAAAYEQWMIGFVSGVSAASPGMAPLFRVDAGAVEQWVDGYCQFHPLDKVAAAGAAFVEAHPR